MVEHKLPEGGRQADEPLRKIAVVAVIENPYAGRYVEDLGSLVEASAPLGEELAKLAVETLAPIPIRR